MVGSNEAGVAFVMSLGISLRRYPTARRAAIFAIGNPVAFEASAEERETLGFISMMTRRPVAGSTANCTLDPPVSTPTRRRHAKASSRIAWYSTSVSVCAGATVMESPVCTPIGSKFSMEHTTTQLSAASRMTSSSNSFQPAIDCSTRICPTGLAARPSEASWVNRAASSAMPVPLPPRMKLGRTMMGKPMSVAISSASPKEWAKPERGTSRPMSCMAALNRSLSSAVAIASGRAPMTSTPYRSSTPVSTSRMVRLRAVCPPRVGSSASGRSLSMMASSTSGSRGST